MREPTLRSGGTSSGVDNGTRDNYPERYISSAMQASKLVRSLMSLLFLSALSYACGDEETCGQVSVYRIDSERQCYGDGEQTPELEACMSEPEKGTAFECVRSPEGELYVAGRNGAARLESASWTLEDQLDAAEKAQCDQVRAVGFPSPRLTCPAE